MTTTATSPRFVIDANCPACGWPERWLDLDTQTFGCSHCDYTSKNRDRCDLDHIITNVGDERTAIVTPSGDLLGMSGYDDRDADVLLQVAEWWDRIAQLATELADDLRLQANQICDACGGAGGVSDDNGDTDCRRCDGTGRIL